MSKMYEKLQKCVSVIRGKTDFVPEVALILGSGLGEYAKNMDVKAEIPYSEIEGFPVSTVAGHDGRFLFGYVGKVPMVIMKGRVHYYEGYDMEEVVMPIRIMGLLGAKKVILTNAAGGVNLDFQPGDLMMITDHISTFVPSPLRGENIDELGTRFPDMSEAYSERMQQIIKKEAQKLGIPLKEGVYLQLTGPSYETPAEIRMYRTCGADAVGMSTACETIAARHMGIEVCGVSCITNLAAGMTSQHLNHQEVQQTADRVAEQFQELLTAIITHI